MAGQAQGRHRQRHASDRPGSPTARSTRPAAPTAVSCGPGPTRAPETATTCALTRRRRAAALSLSWPAGRSTSPSIRRGGRSRPPAPGRDVGRPPQPPARDGSPMRHAYNHFADSWEEADEHFEQSLAVVPARRLQLAGPGGSPWAAGSARRSTGTSSARPVASTTPGERRSQHAVDGVNQQTRQNPPRPDRPERLRRSRPRTNGSPRLQPGSIPATSTTHGRCATPGVSARTCTDGCSVASSREQTVWP